MTSYAPAAINKRSSDNIVRNDCACVILYLFPPNPPHSIDRRNNFWVRCDDSHCAAQLSKVELIDTTPPRTFTPRLVLLLASLSALLASLDSSVNIAFPAIAAAFSLDVPSMQWIVISYVLT